MGATREQLKRLGEPFDPRDIEWRVQTAGDKNGKPWARVLAYITNRAIQDRLDTVVGPENWQDEFKPGPDGGITCGIGIYCERADDMPPAWVWKWDGAENTDIEAVKGGLSNAEKRAGCKWGIGRYLYQLEEGWADVSEAGQFSAKTKDGKWFKWNPPPLPPWALPGGSGKPDGSVTPPASSGATTRSTPPTSGGGGSANAPPSTATPNATAPRRGEHHGSPGLDEVGVPLCPKCGGRCWDNRVGKRNPKAPDFKCRDRACDGVIWPEKKAAPVSVPPDDEPPPYDDDDDVPF